jgi:hypothetical protein
VASNQPLVVTTRIGTELAVKIKSEKQLPPLAPHLARLDAAHFHPQGPKVAALLDPRAEPPPEDLKVRVVVADRRRENWVNSH